MDRSHPANYRQPGIEQSWLNSHNATIGSHQSPSFSFQNSRPSTPSNNSSPRSWQGEKNQLDSSTYARSSQTEAESVASRLRQMSTDEVERLLNNKKSYEDFFNSLDLLREERQLQNELVEESIQLARHLLEMEPWVLELKNQCVIIRTTELVAAQEKLSQLERQKEEMLKCYALESLLQMSKDSAEKMASRSEGLYGQVLGKEIELSTFIQNYKELRTRYHRYSLIHLAAKNDL